MADIDSYEFTEKERIISDINLNEAPLTHTQNIDSELAMLIHSLVKNDKNVQLDNLSDNDIEKTASLMNVITEELIRDSKSGLLSKQYFRLYLAPKLAHSDKMMSATYVSTAGIKLSNSAYDHVFTDYRIDKNNSSFVNAMSDKINYNDNSFDFSENDIYFINHGAGDFLLLYPSEYVTSVQPKIKDAIEEHNKNVNMKDPSSIFFMGYDYDKDISKESPEDLISSIRNLKYQTNYNKDIYKKMLCNSTDALSAFEKSMDYCVDFYLENIPNGFTDISKKSVFMHNLFSSLVNYEDLHNTTREDIKTTGTKKNNKSSNLDSDDLSR